MANANFTFGIDRRRLLTSAAAAATATGVALHLRRADAAFGPATVQAASATTDKAALSISAGTAKRLLEIARRNQIRREAALPLLSVVPELRRMKKVEMEEEFAKFEAAHGRVVLDAMLNRRREEEGDPNWRPSWMEGVAIQSRVRGILQERFDAARRTGKRAAPQ